LAKGWDKALINLKLRAREWKYFLEGYQGASLVLRLWGGGGADRIPDAAPPSNKVPSPRMGDGGYDPQDFEDRPEGYPQQTLLFGAQDSEPFGWGGSGQV
jgi:hypothetical protein